VEVVPEETTSDLVERLAAACSQDYELLRSIFTWICTVSLSSPSMTIQVRNTLLCITQLCIFIFSNSRRGLEEDSGPTSAKTNLENILHKGESATHKMDAILKRKIAEDIWVYFGVVGTGY